MFQLEILMPFSNHIFLLTFGFTNKWQENLSNPDYTKEIHICSLFIYSKRYPFDLTKRGPCCTVDNSPKTCGMWRNINNLSVHLLCSLELCMPLKLFDSNSNCTEHVDREAQSIHSINRVFIIHTEEGN